MCKIKKMNFYYFGSDDTWQNLLDTGFRRRNTWILKTFIGSLFFNNVYIIHQTTRKNLLKNLFKKQKSKHKDIFFAFFLPLSFKLNTINKFFIKLVFRIQGVKNINSKSNIVWSYWPNGFKTAERINLKGRYFFDTDHNIINDDNLDKTLYKKQSELLFRAGKKCEKIISSSRSMLYWYKSRGFTNIYRLRNGICLKRFSNIKIKELDVKKPIIGYVGTLSKWIDYDIFEALIKNNIKWSFVIYGKDYKTERYRNLKKYSNVYFKGELNAENLPATIKNFDVALNLYQKRKWLDVDSMKIYEYLAAGIPVVTSVFHDYLDEDFENLLFLGRTYNEIQKHINFLIDNPLDKDYAIKFIERNTWQNRVQSFMEILA